MKLVMMKVYVPRYTLHLTAEKTRVFSLPLLQFLDINLFQHFFPNQCVNSSFKSQHLLRNPA